MSDILIRGMGNIPVGQEFVIVENIDFERYLYNRETGAAFHLVLLPEGHGKLGDLDKIVSFIDYYERPMDRNTSPFKALNAVRDYICNASTLIPAEEGKAV